MTRVSTLARVPSADGSAPARASQVPHGRRRAAALALLVSAQFVVMLDTSIVNVALPSIQADLGLRPAGLAWVVNAYVLAFGGLLMLAGRVADLVGRRRVFVIGSAVFTAGTLVAATVSTEAALVLGRVVQGVGAAGLSPSAMALLLVMFPGGARARAMSLWGAASALGGATGVVVGGVLAGTLGWSWVFLATVPITAVGIIAAGRVLDSSAPATSRRIDCAGAGTLTGAVLALSYSALAVADHGWTSVPTVLSAATAAVLLTTFVVVERMVDDPLVPLDLFASRTVSVGVLLGVLGGAARASSFVLIALYLQQSLLLAPHSAGLAMLPTSLAGFVASLALLPRVVRALGPQGSLVLGLVVLAAGHLWLARTPSSAAYLLDVLPGLLLVATGVALSFTPTTMVMASGVSSARAGLVSGLAGSSTQVGAALGTAAFTAVALTASDGVGSEVAVIPSRGFSAAFTAAAAVALVTATLGSTLLTRRSAADGDSR